MYIKRNSSVLFALPCLSLAALSAHAQTAADIANASANSSELSEVIVTAERRSIDLQKVALSVTAIGGDEIAKNGDADVAQVLQDVPGVVLEGLTNGPSQQSVQGGGGPPNIAIRGLGTPSPNTVSAVAVYEDGVLMQGGGANFYDMSRVEVLRGPQGTLYGRGATAGAVNFITNDPTQQLEASGRIQYGNYDTVATQGVLNLPLADVLSLRVAFNQIRHNGYFNNGQSDEDDISSRVKLLYRPNDAVSLLVGYVDYTSKSTGAGQIDLATNTAPTQWVTNVLGGGSNPVSYRKTYADLQWDLGFADFTYIGGYQTENSTFTTYCNCFFGFTYQDVTQPYNTTWTHELRLASRKDSPLTWVAGAYYFHNHMATTFAPGTNAPIEGEAYVPAFSVLQTYDPTSIGVFGEATYAVTSTVRLTGGVRETRDHVVQSQVLPFSSPDDYDQTLHHFDWKARAETDLSDSSLLYTTVSTGYRPGGFTNGIKSENEVVHAYEVGSKNRIDSMLTLDGALFYYNYSGFQNAASVPNTTTGAVETILVPIPAKFYGGELEAVAQLSPADRVTVSPALLIAKYTANAATYETDGGEIPNTPKWSLSGSYQHNFDIAADAQLTWGIDSHYQTQELTDFNSENYPTPQATYLQKAYEITNTSLSFTPKKGNYTISLYGKNLFGTLYKVTVYNQGPPAAAYVSDPRTYGVMISGRL